MRARISSMVVLAASLLVASQVWAQSDGSTTFGGQWWSQTNPEAKYQEYRVLPRGGFIDDYLLREFNGPWAGAIWGNDALQKDQANGLYLAKGVKWRLDARYNESPHLFSKVALSPYARNSPGVFVLPDSLQKTIQSLRDTLRTNASVLDMLRNAPGTTLDIQTDVSKVRLRARPWREWRFEVRGTNRERSGSLPFGTPFGFTAIELPAPIDQRTLDVDATGTYTHGPARVMVTLGVSDFHNRVSTLRFDNFKVLTPTYTSAANPGQMALWPDNRVLRGRASLSWRLPYTSTFTATLGVSQTEQKQAFAPMTVNPVIAGISQDSLLFERQDLEGKVMDIVQDYRLTGRPMPKLYATLRFREEKMDDKTPLVELPYGYVNYDQTWARTPTEAEPWGHKSDVFGLDADYAVFGCADLSLLAERRMREHPNREVEKDAENVIGGRVRVRPMSGLDAAVGYKYAQRKLDSFILEAYEGLEWPAFRRFDVADRNQTAADGAVGWSPMSRVDLSVNGWWTKDDYPNSALGLRKSENRQVFAEGTIHAAKELDLSGGYGYGVIDGTQSSIEISTGVVSADSAQAPWTAKLRDRNVYYFARAEWWPKPERLEVTGGYTFTRDLADYDFTNARYRNRSFATPSAATVTAIPLPSNFYRTHEYEAEARWHYSASFEFGCRFEYTTYFVDDPLAQVVPLLNVDPTNYGLGQGRETLATAVFLGSGRLKYNASRIQVMATRRF